MSQAISLQPVPEFNPDSGEVGASLATLWKKWLADFEMFTTAAGITDTRFFFYKEPTSRPSSKSSLFIDLKSANCSTKSSLIVP